MLCTRRVDQGNGHEFVVVVAGTGESSGVCGVYTANRVIPGSYMTAKLGSAVRERE